MAQQTVHRICPLCEATCGLELTIEDGRVTRIRGDEHDPFSEGYICPKGIALKDLHADPDTLKTPLIKEGDGFREATWEEAFEEIERRLPPIIAESGKNAVGVYVGNPAVHKTSLIMYLQVVNRLLGTRNVFSASTVDQFPKQLATGLMFGTGLSVPIPDIDRTDYMMILGANPLVSNGSLMTAPNYGERMRRVRERGGKIVVIDPKRTKTAESADEHHFIKPGTDAFFLFGIVHTLIAEGLTKPGRLAEFTDGLDRVEELAPEYSPEAVAPICGIDAETIRRFAREIAAAPSACVYGRIGTCTQEFGTIASWLPEVIHILTGNLDRPGGAMFPLAPHGPSNAKGKPRVGKGIGYARHTSRVRGLPEVYGEFPCSCLPEEIETPGEGQIRALLTVAGNPVISNPDGERLSRALDKLDFMVSIDIYLNETTRHADVILPGTSPLEELHYDIAFTQLAVRNVARYSPALFKPETERPYEWQVLLKLAAILGGMGAKADTAMSDMMVINQLVQREVKSEGSPIHGRNANEIVQALAPRVGPERILDFMLRTGPYGDGFGANPDGLTLSKLDENPRGIDLGPLQPRMPEMLRTPSGMIELTPEPIMKDLARLSAKLGEGAAVAEGAAANGGTANGAKDANGSAKTNGHLTLIGRRHLFTNNSWMHNIKRLQAGKPTCTLQINPADAERLGLAEGDTAQVESRVGRVEIPVEITDTIMAGVVSAPHGWGHSEPGLRMEIAAANPGVNSNLLSDGYDLDGPSGTVVLCGIPVTVGPAAVGAGAGGSREAAAQQ